MSEIIDMLNSQVICKLGQSKIHGVGVFAIKDIRKGQKMYCLGTPNQTGHRLKSLKGLLPEVKKLLLQRWPMAKDGGVFQSPNDDARLISFMNHGSKPNYDNTNDTAFTDIKKGQEVLEDYGIVTFKVLY